ncbi:hypothetical protein Tco_0231204, partial [Tanacetum coccineum]
FTNPNPAAVAQLGHQFSAPGLTCHPFPFRAKPLISGWWCVGPGVTAANDDNRIGLDVIVDNVRVN